MGTLKNEDKNMLQIIPLVEYALDSFHIAHRTQAQDILRSIGVDSIEKALLYLAWFPIAQWIFFPTTIKFC